MAYDLLAAARNKQDRNPGLSLSDAIAQCRGFANRATERTYNLIHRPCRYCSGSGVGNVGDAPDVPNEPCWYCEGSGIVGHDARF